ncbi:MAG: response regulator [Candidatus Omnitrophica bacterium]|nr:response regulator [Candidatus Omnitrophota bacterium]MCM8803220.1 response regulator [Candidatus Omnitrophota bacterium]
MKEYINQEDFFSQSDIKKNFDEKKDTILVIDDEIGPRESLRILFKYKYNVITAEDGEKGIEIVKNRKVDIIILDLRMPGKNGIETLAEIRKYNQNVPVIILTGYGDMETARKAMHYEVLEFMSKPFSITEMEEIVEKGIEKGKIKIETEKLKEELTFLKDTLIKRINEVENLAVIGQTSLEIIHEVNNLLAVIQGYTQLLSEEVNSKKITLKYLTIIEREIKRCKNIAKSILELAKKEQTSIEQVSLNELIENIIEFLKGSHLCKNINFLVKIPEYSVIVKSNYNHLHQAIFNIFLNCIQELTKEKEKEGIINVEISKTTDKVILYIRDNGKGIPPEIIEKTKEPFYTTKQEGTGLGLYLTTKIISKYGGRFEINSKINEGSEFRITFPLS